MWLRVFIITLRNDNEPKFVFACRAFDWRYNPEMFHATSKIPFYCTVAGKCCRNGKLFPKGYSETLCFATLVVTVGRYPSLGVKFRKLASCTGHFGFPLVFVGGFVLASPYAYMILRSNCLTHGV